MTLARDAPPASRYSASRSLRINPSVVRLSRFAEGLLEPTARLDTLNRAGSYLQGRVADAAFTTRRWRRGERDDRSHND